MSFSSHEATKSLHFPWQNVHQIQSHFPIRWQSTNFRHRFEGVKLRSHFSIFVAVLPWGEFTEKCSRSSPVDQSLANPFIRFSRDRQGITYTELRANVSDTIEWLRSSEAVLPHLKPCASAHRPTPSLPAFPSKMSRRQPIAASAPTHPPAPYSPPAHSCPQTAPPASPTLSANSSVPDH